MPGAGRFEVLGVRILDATLEEASGLVEGLIDRPEARTRTICFVNANSLNLASSDQELAEALRTADYVFGDGTGVRWAVHYIHRHRLRDNVNGTDLVPFLFSSLASRGYRYYLLGGRQQMLDRAVVSVRGLFPGWTLVGSHHGYLDPAASEAVVADINDRKPDLLLVGMGSPAQEKWILNNAGKLRIPLCMAIGGLMAYWAGELTRAPAWLRRSGFEWVHLMIRQPRKLSRYLLGNPAFVCRVLRSRRRDLDGARS
jgi:N-acetylglucosaminyldiphosphoundecaprenol N-acetyl-beta-D-mannosaminyltransferase